jgi:PAS domain S-box-containing protein
MWLTNKQAQQLFERKMDLNQVFQKFQANYERITDFYQSSKALDKPNSEVLNESFEELAVALEELSVAQEELLQQNQELQSARNQIEAQRQRYQDLFNLAPDAYLVTDGAGIIRSANRAASNLLAVPQANLHGKPMANFIPIKERSIFRTQLNQLHELENLPEWELQMLPRTGEPVETAVTVSVLSSGNNGHREWLWLIRDISERRRTEAAVKKLEMTEAANRILEGELRERQRLESALRQSEARFRYIFESVGVSIWEEDFTPVKQALTQLQASGVGDLRQYCVEHPEFVAEMIDAVKILDINEMTRQLFEAESKEQLLGSLQQIFLPETSEIFIEELLSIAAGETMFLGETVLQTLTGKRLDILFNLVFSGSGVLDGRTLVTLLDISDRKQAEIQLQQQAEVLGFLNTTLTQTAQQLTERNLELDQFVYVVSHDLKAPLRGIANLAKWLADDLAGQLNEDNQHQMELLQQRVSRMEKLIDGLLAYSRVGRAETSSVSVDVAELLDEILDSLAPPPTFIIEVPAVLPTLKAKRLLLSQVFANLISNAIKHHDRANGRIDIFAEERGDFCKFTVADDGPGIPPEYHEKVFSIFQTLNKDSTHENTGIGLSIVKKILEAEGGDIWLESQVGKGTAFYFTWPKNSQE